MVNFLDLIFPRKCLGCGKTGAYFCSQCLNFVSLEQERICPVCERPSVGGQTHPGCQKSHSLDGLTSVFSYKGIVKEAIIKLKYNFVSDLAEDLAEAFLSFCGEDGYFALYCQKNDPILAPISLYKTRERWRGFNQSELLGKMIAQNLGLRFTPDLLIRVKNTKPQMELSEKQRRENIRGAFSVNPRFPRPLYHFSFIIFDDVWTSGSTIKEAAKVLKQAGAKQVWGLTLAR
jgi:ComF family protein